MLRSTIEKFGNRVKFIAPTRFDNCWSTGRARNGGRGWKESYHGLESVKVEINEEAMIAYGVSATPTFFLIDRKGIVRLYSPTRFTGERVSAEMEGC